MSAETKKEVIIEYPIDIVFNTLISIFPVKYYELIKFYPSTHTLRVYDSFNSGFTMRIKLKENTLNSTIVIFVADYPQALMDLTGGGKQAIEMVLEELLNQLDKQYPNKSSEILDSTIEVVNKDNFVNTTKNNPHTFLVVIGYILSVLSIVMPLYALINYNPDDFIMASVFVVGILCLSSEISLSVILQYYENPKTVFHGRIQLLFCSLSLIFYGLIIHPALAIVGIVIPIIAFGYFFKREKATE